MKSFIRVEEYLFCVIFCFELTAYGHTETDCGEDKWLCFIAGSDCFFLSYFAIK